VIEDVGSTGTGNCAGTSGSDSPQLELAEPRKREGDSCLGPGAAPNLVFPRRISLPGVARGQATGSGRASRPSQFPSPSAPITKGSLEEKGVGHKARFSFYL
jgi:hypothetical protein